MPVISDAQIAALAKSQGLTSVQSAIAVAVALAESGGNTHAHNAVPPDDSYGLWQINMLGSLGPSRREQFGITNNAALFDPAINAKAMAQISRKGSNWLPWTTYTSGVYLRYLARAKTAVNGSAETPAPTQPIATSDNPLKPISDFARMLTDKGTWIRVGLFGVGMLLVLIALAKMTGDNQLSDTTKKIVGLVVTRKVVK